MPRRVGAARAPECAAGSFPFPLSLTLPGAGEEDQGRAAALRSRGADCPGLPKLCAERGLTRQSRAGWLAWEGRGEDRPFSTPGL